MAELEIISHRGEWVSNSKELKLPQNVARQHTRAAFESAMANRFGVEFDLMPGLSNGVSVIAITAAYPYDDDNNNFEFPSGTLTLPELLELRRDFSADGQYPGTAYFDMKQGRDRLEAARLVGVYEEKDHRIINVQNPSDWSWFAKTTEFKDKVVRLYDDENPLLPGSEKTAVFRQAGGIMLNAMNPFEEGGLKAWMDMADRALANGKNEVLFSLGDITGWGINPHEHDENKQPYRRKAVEMFPMLQDIVAKHPNAEIKILTNFPRWARDHFGPVLG